MLGLTLRHLIRACDNLIVRNYRGMRLPPGKNPGLDRRIKAFKEEGLKIEDDDAEEFIESSQSDFSKVGELYSEHMNETLVGKHDLRQNIVKEKYFKENMPNLLTWSEKEQIRHLANTEPDEWTPERIAESFPVTVPIVKKLLKYPWKPATEQRIARHDASVLRNWRELREGSFTIDESLRQHFLKFSNRIIPPLRQESVKVNITTQQEMGEFQRIVQRCAQQDYNEDNQQHTSELTDGTKQAKTKQKGENKVMTLDDLAERIKSRLDSGSIVDINDEIITKSVYQKKSEISIISENKEIESHNTSDKGKELQEYNSKDSKNENSIMDYPERIRIPKKAYKKGATYKVNDCYYDHDGRFLYRVLGMSNNTQ